MVRMLSIVIPTLNAAATLDRTLRAAQGSGVAGEVVVVDGGSHDFTTAVAKRHGARVIAADAGRGAQLSRGAAEARGDWLLLLHPDVILAPGWAQAAAAFVTAPENAGRAGYFRFALDERTATARLVERLASWRGRIGLPHGEQGLLLSRALFETVCGVRAPPPIADVELASRLGRDRLVALDAAAVVPARRHRVGGWLLQPLRGLPYLGLRRLGVSPSLLARL
jgi:glycosyltransferase involved in cell wall biosynthesis